MLDYFCCQILFSDLHKGLDFKVNMKIKINLFYFLWNLVVFILFKI